MDAEHLLGGPLERNRPAVVAEAKVLGCCVAVKVPGHRLGDDEREDARLAAIVQLAEPVQERHACCARNLPLYCFVSALSFLLLYLVVVVVVAVFDLSPRDRGLAARAARANNVQAEAFFNQGA